MNIDDYQWWCPDCGRWINPGEGKFTDDNFIVHKDGCQTSLTTTVPLDGCTITVITHWCDETRGWNSSRWLDRTLIGYCAHLTPSLTDSHNAATDPESCARNVIRYRNAIRSLQALQSDSDPSAQ